MNLKDHLSKEAGLSDCLNYAHFIEDGVIINKDGAFLVTYTFRGPDINSASGGELDSLTANFNRMALLLEDGWMLHVDDLRIPSLNYPNNGYFPDPVSALIDEERRQLYESEGTHYENFQFITFVWKFPMTIVNATRHWFVDGVTQENNDQNLSKLLHYFLETVERCIHLFKTHAYIKKLSSSDLLSYLNTCITGDLLPVTVPSDGCFLDVVLARKSVSGGYVPKIGNKYICVLSIIGYLNETTMPGLLEQMGTYPMVYRWSNRFIPLSEDTAEKEIKRYQKNWNNKVKGFTGIIKEVISGKPSNKVNIDALQMSHQTVDALTLNSNQSTRFGYWSSEIVLIHDRIETIEQAVKDISRYLEQSGFSCIKEDVNTFDAWLGTIPGHGSCNVRRLFVNSINLAHVLPLNSVWAGEKQSPVSSLLPKGSPPVFYAATTGKIPYRFHLDVADVGHQMVLGPTGAGKSTYLGFLIAQFLRYKDANIFVFDKDESHKALTYALGGHHYDIGNASALSFCPLSDLSTDSKRVRAEQFIEDLVFLQQIKLTPDMRMAIHDAIKSLSHPEHANNRNLTIFKSEVQNDIVRSAIQYYTIEGQLKLLDSTTDSLKSGYLQTFEMNWLLNQKPEIYLPVLRYIFDEIESSLEEANGSKPTLIILEEAWLYIAHEVFAKKLKDWLKTLRKKNARVIFATQSLSDLYDPSTKSLTGTTAVMMESCPTKIYLPNISIESEIKELYFKMGLSERQVDIISRIAIAKQHYYIVQPNGNRLIDLGLQGPKSLALSFIGLSKKRAHELISCINQYGDEWIIQWLEHCHLSEWIDFINQANIRSHIA